MKPNKHIILYGTHSKGGGLLLYTKTSQCENNDAYTCMPFLVEIWAWNLNYHAYLTSQYTSHELHSMLSMRGFHCIVCISSYLGDVFMMLSEHLTWMSEFEELGPTKVHGGSSMWLDMLWNFYVALGSVFEG